MKQHHAPCDECAFRRSIEPGFLGGSPPEVYVGQINGPFWIPCHCPKNYDQKGMMNKGEAVLSEHAECVGSAVFRANLGVADRYPDEFMAMPADHINVFSTYAEFVAHHMRITIAEAQALLEMVPPTEWTRVELNKAEVKLIKKL